MEKPKSTIKCILIVLLMLHTVEVLFYRHSRGEAEIHNKVYTDCAFFFTCRPNHNMGPIFYLRNDARAKSEVIISL